MATDHKMSIDIAGLIAALISVIQADKEIEEIEANEEHIAPIPGDSRSDTIKIQIKLKRRRQI